MFPATSYLLLKTKCPSIDTSFKHLHGWQEFEMEAFFPEVEHSLVVARAFTTSQSAEAHLNLFRCIFQIVEEDTGEHIKFRHIHSNGIDTITADGHHGQALGLGLYCQELCRGNTEYCSIEHSQLLSSLTPTDHLLGHVSNDVLEAMRSLATADPLLDLEAVFELIHNGGKKALDWLKDKESNNGFALAAIYQPASKMSCAIWQAAPMTSNGNKQAPCNINRDGTKLTLLAGIMRGLQYNSCAIIFLDTFLKEGIYSCNCHFTHFQRASQAIRWKGMSQEKAVILKDSEITTNYKKILKLQDGVQSAAKLVKHSLEPTMSHNIEPAKKRLFTAVDKLEKSSQQLDKIKTQGSGAISTSGLLEMADMFDPELLQSTGQ
ncbi:hypothetical protein Clacol_003410 [Clathrus columnatus]|uniref:Uncharacterized protein n=1 Tax=Clathrus columnatus TaxID=1419009 RepID=A0AAV5A7J8_9AGAM|nr:hypothetical protein Clacol_003410 [Clathrus columnatus]